MVLWNAQCGLTVLLLATIGLSISPGRGQTSDNEYQPAKIVSVREVWHASFPVSRYPTTPHYTLDLAVVIGNQSYCAAYETPVLDEVRDLVAADRQDVAVAVHGKKIVLILPHGRRIQTNLVKLSQC